MDPGRLLHEQSVASRFLGTNRGVRLYLPPSYAHQPAARYPVLYVHDGQNVFSSAGPHCCFGWGSWELDQTADRLCAAGRMREIIIVAIDNSPARYQEYRGPIRGARDAVSQTSGGVTTAFDRYAAFLVRELKPWVDREYRTSPRAADTGLMGSSLGGICSLALAWRHPGTFGLVASLSGSFQVEQRHFLRHVLGAHRGRRKAIKIYLDSGILDSSGDDDGRRNTAAAARDLRRLGWSDGRNLYHYVDEHLLTEAELGRAGLGRHKWEEARRSQHNEFYWRQRVWRALEFLFPPGFERPLRTRGQSALRQRARVIRP